MMLARFLPPMIRRIRQVLTFVGVTDTVISIALTTETGVDTVVSEENALSVALATETGVAATLDVEGG